MDIYVVPELTMLSLLPENALQRIAAMTHKISTSDFHNLRLSSKAWKEACNSSITTSCCNYDSLQPAVQFMSGLPFLAIVVINCSNNIGHVLKGNALGALGPNLRSLSLLSELPVHVPGQEVFNHQLEVEDLGQLLHPWEHSICRLHFENCIFTSEDGTLISPSFFARFPNLVVLLMDSVASDPALMILDLSECAQLRTVHCISCALQFLNVTGCNKLKVLDCNNNQLTSLMLGAFLKLSELDCSNNQLSALELPVSAAFQILDCSANHLQTLDMSRSPSLLKAVCKDNDLVSINLSESASLETLDVEENSLSTLNLAASHQLIDLFCSDNNLVSLQNIATCTALQRLECNNNQLIILDLSENSALRIVDCSSNELVLMALSGLSQLDKLDCRDNDVALAFADGGSALNLVCDSSHFGSVSPHMKSALVTLDLAGSEVVDLVEGFANLEHMRCCVGPMGSISLEGSASVVLSVRCATDNLSIHGRSAVHTFYLSGVLGLSNFQRFIALQKLDIELINNNMSELDVSACGRLRKLYVTVGGGASAIASINVGGCTLLEELKCEDCPELTQLDVSPCPNLVWLKVTGSSLAALDVSCCPLLTRLEVSRSPLLATLNTTNCARLTEIITVDCPGLI